jgi:hypothetical protein
MSNISGIRLHRLLQGMVSEKLRRKAATGSDPCSVVRDKAGSNPDLQLELTQRLASLDPADPAAEEQAVHIFIETVLAREFGARLMQEQSGHELLLQVRSAMLGAPEVRATLLSMLKAMARQRSD